MTSLKYLLNEGRIEAVEPDIDAAKNKLEEAKRHLASAAAIADDDPEGAYSLVYDAARKAADAHMLANGYRASKSKVGAHEATARYVEAVIKGKYASDARSFNRMRKQRNRTEYGTGTSHPQRSKPTAPTRRVSSKLSKLLSKAKFPEVRSGSSSNPRQRVPPPRRSLRRASRSGQAPPPRVFRLFS
jgi:hypothetical protein